MSESATEMRVRELSLTEASLNPPSGDPVGITIDGRPLSVPAGENVIESAKRAGIDIPYFCYHPRLSKGDAANCRMCLVDVFMPRKGPDGSVTLAKMPKPQTACTLPAAEGMVVETMSEGVVKDRRGVLEFLLINHPLDCPICDRGGECPLQNNTLFYGPPTSRFVEEKRHFPKAYPLSEHVVFDRERCIHCARCTRFTEDISGERQLAFHKRAADMEVGTFAYTEYVSRFTGNVIELCPVGALLSRDYRFKARPWDLLSQRSVCSLCSNGCNIKIDYRRNEILRINARLNEAVNEEWTCDRGKFGHGYVDAQDRLKTPMLKRDGGWSPCSWDEAYTLLSEKLRAAGPKAGGIGGERCTNEDLYVFQRLFREVLRSDNLDHRIRPYQGPSGRPLFDRFGYHGMGNGIADLEKMRSIFVVGGDLIDEQPIVYLRTRKAWRFHGARVVVAAPLREDYERLDRDYPEIEMRYAPASLAALVGGLAGVLLTENVIPSSDATAPLQAAARQWPLVEAARETGLAPEVFREACRILGAGPMAILAGTDVVGHPRFEEIGTLLGDITVATGNAGNLNIPGAECNTQGAIDMGILPDSGPGYASVASPGLSTQQMLEAAVEGKLAALWIVGAKLVEKYHDPGLARRALETCPFVVVSDLRMTGTAQMADLVLPVASFAEKDGTFTNCERRVQQIRRAVDSASDVKPDWVVFTEVADQLGAQFGYVSPRDILRDLTGNVPLYVPVTEEALEECGVRVGGERPPAP